MRSHLDTLYDNLLEQNLTRIIEPFLKVQIEHIAKLIKLPKETVEMKLSQMILDKKLSGELKLLRWFNQISNCASTGILDQGTGALILFETAPSDKVYENSLSIVQSFGKVVDSLYTKVKKLS